MKRLLTSTFVVLFFSLWAAAQTAPPAPSKPEEPADSKAFTAASMIKDPDKKIQGLEHLF